MAVKSFPARVKSVEPGQEPAQAGEFEAVISVFGNVDSMREVVRPGAFSATLADWKASGAPIPVLWSHRMDDPAFNIGAVAEAYELAPNDSRLPDWAPQAVKDNGGLWIRALLDTGEGASAVAAQTHRLLKEGRVRQFSFAYDVLDGGPETVDGQDVYALRELKLHEASVTQVGANDSTTLLGVKDATLLALQAKTGRVLSAKNEANIRKAVDLLTETLAALDQDGKCAPANAEEPHGAKAEEPARYDPIAVRLLCDLANAEAANDEVRTP